MATDCDVIIAGLGPVGAALAALLGQNGVSVIVIEPERDIYPLPRAAHIDHEIMRIFQAIGIADAIFPHIRPAPDYEFRSAAGALLMRVERAGRLGVSGWPVSYNIYQPGIERVLRSHLSKMPGVRVLYGSRFTGLVENGASRVVVAAQDQGGEARYSSLFLVGCDGARSEVRQACGSILHDHGFDEPWLVVDARVDDEARFPSANIQYCDPSRPTSFVHMGPGRLRWEFMLKPGESPQDLASDECVAALLAPWLQFGAIQPERRAVYRFHGLIARRWRDNRVFLAGDAAHQMPPFMGQGLCAGLRDACNLAWKLQAAVAGMASEALLDSYQAEREPHVAFVVNKAIEMGRIVCTLDADEAAARDARMLAHPVSAPPAAFPRLQDGCLMHGSPGAGSMFPQTVHAQGTAAPAYLDDRLGAGAWLLHEAAAPEGRETACLRIVNLAEPCSPEVQAVRNWLSAHNAASVLVRPDRVVFGTGDPDTLARLYAHWLLPARSAAAV